MPKKPEKHTPGMPPHLKPKESKAAPKKANECGRNARGFSAKHRAIQEKMGYDRYSREWKKAFMERGNCDLSLELISALKAKINEQVWYLKQAEAAGIHETAGHLRNGLENLGEVHRNAVKWNKKRT